MPLSELQLARHRRQLGLWVVLAWFVFVNVVFYWRLFQERVRELPLIWQQLLKVLQ